MQHRFVFDFVRKQTMMITSSPLSTEAAAVPMSVLIDYRLISIESLQVGRLFKGGQPVTLQMNSYCVDREATIMHEFIHGEREASDIV